MSEIERHAAESGLAESNLSIKWMVFSGVTILFQIAFSLYYFRNNEWHPGTTGGMAYGAVSCLVAIFLSAYLVRKNIYRTKLGSMRWWYLGHIHIGLLSVLFVFLHSGFGLFGFFTIFLLLLFILTVATGIVGWFIYAMLPVSNARQIGSMYVEQELIDEIEKRSREIEEYLSAKPKYFGQLTEKHVGDCYSNSGATVRRILMSERELLNLMKLNFNQMRGELPPHELYSLDFLQSLCVEREKSIARVLRLKLMRGWLDAHVPLTAALLTAIAVHLISIWYF